MTASARQGEPLRWAERDTPFSFWPATEHRYGLGWVPQYMVFVSDPWSFIKRALREHFGRQGGAEARAYLEQAADFHNAAVTSKMAAARPLAQYYSAMNLAKAYCLTVGGMTTLDEAQHGLSERKHDGQLAFHGAFLRAYPSPPAGRPNVYSEFMKSATGTAVHSPHEDLEIMDLLSQILIGHRVWCRATNSHERFTAVHEVRFMHQERNKEVWLRLYFMEGDVKRVRYQGSAVFAEHTGLVEFVEVESDVHGCICYEQIVPTKYDTDKGEAAKSVVALIRPLLWSSVSSVKPYRRYYVYAAENGDRSNLVPQLMSIYALTYYLGSITRYHPHQFDMIEGTSYGPFIQEFLLNQPNQFLYLMASHFAKQDVSRAAII